MLAVEHFFFFATFEQSTRMVVNNVVFCVQLFIVVWACEKTRVRFVRRIFLKYLPPRSNDILYSGKRVSLFIHVSITRESTRRIDKIVKMKVGNLDAN